MYEHGCHYANMNRIVGVTVNMLVASVVNRGLLKGRIPPSIKRSIFRPVLKGSELTTLRTHIYGVVLNFRCQTKRGHD
jgi:hypothetical protein